MDGPPLIVGQPIPQVLPAILAPPPCAVAAPWQPVHRSLVHKRDGDQVVIRKFRSDSKENVLFDVRDARVRLAAMVDDAGFVAEALRQSTIALAHLRHGVADDWAFLMDRMWFRLHAASLYRFPPTTVRINARDVQTRVGNLHSLTSIFELLSDKHVIATGEGYLRVINQRVYRRLRRGRDLRQPSRTLLRSAQPITLSRDAIDSSPGKTSWAASIDAEDPFFFDHEVDHLPGMAIYEAACAVASLASLAATPRVVSFDGEFHEFVELDEQLKLSATTSPQGHLGDPNLVTVAVSSKGRLAMSAMIGVSEAQATRSAD